MFHAVTMSGQIIGSCDDVQRLLTICCDINRETPFDEPGKIAIFETVSERLYNVETRESIDLRTATSSSVI